jgi:hypothetical protein
MHAKFMHELCSLLLYIPKYLDVIIFINFGDFKNNPLSLVLTLFGRKMLF